jgi:hypothetical protein
VRISGRFFPQGAGAIVNTQQSGQKGWTVARTSQGVFTLTIDRRWLKLVPTGLSLQLSAAADRKLQYGTFVAGTSSWAVQIRCVDNAGAVQDIAANADNSIGFELEAVQDTVAG